MEKIEKIEKRYDPQISGSFHPLSQPFGIVLTLSILISLQSSTPALTAEPGTRLQVPLGWIETTESAQSQRWKPAARPKMRGSLFLPCHYFDYAVGTSTGGSVIPFGFSYVALIGHSLIAIMLGRLRMTVNDCIAEFQDLGEKVFGHPRLALPGLTAIMPRDKYDHIELEKAIKDIVRKQGPEFYSDTLFRQPNDTMCRT